MFYFFLGPEQEETDLKPEYIAFGFSWMFQKTKGETTRWPLNQFLYEKATSHCGNNGDEEGFIYIFEESQIQIAPGVSSQELKDVQMLWDQEQQDWTVLE